MRILFHGVLIFFFNECHPSLEILTCLKENASAKLMSGSMGFPHKWKSGFRVFFFFNFVSALVKNKAQRTLINKHLFF